MICCFFIYALLIILFCLIFKYFILEKFFLPNIGQRAVFITGCDTGFGQKLVLRLLAENVPTFAGCYSKEGGRNLEILSEKLPGRLIVVDLDVKSSLSIENAKRIVHKELNGKNLWGIVCNAGVSDVNGPDDFLTVEDYVSTLDVNTFGVIRTCHAFKPLIKKSKGRLVIMCSMLGRMALPYLGPYTVSKHAMIGYSDTLRLEAKPFGFTVHTLEPGFFKTVLTDSDCVLRNYARLWAKVSPEVKEEYGEVFYKEVGESVKNSLSLWSCENLNLVIDAYFHALMSRFPRNRYVVGPDAKYIFGPLSLLPSWFQDIVIDLMGKREKLPVPLVCRKSPKND